MALLRSSAVVHATCSPRIPIRQYTRRVSAWRASYPVVDQVPCIMSSPAAQPAMQPAASAVPWQQCWIQQDMSRACEVVLPDSIRVQSRVLLPVLAANLVPMPQGLPHLSRLTTAVKVQLMQLLVTAAQRPEQTEQLLAAALDAIMEHAQSSCQKVRLTETSPNDTFDAHPLETRPSRHFYVPLHVHAVHVPPVQCHTTLSTVLRCVQHAASAGRPQDSS